MKQIKVLANNKVPIVGEKIFLTNIEADELVKVKMSAKEEGFELIATTFHNVREAEEHHAKRFKKLYEVLINGTIFDKDTETTWFCRKCGYLYKGKSAPEHCPNCHHPQGYFQVLCEKY